MFVGTQSLLFGAHQFILHPIFMAKAWKIQYGEYPDHPAVYVAFVVHDWGYWGLDKMDGPEGIDHPERGARILEKLFPGILPEKYRGDLPAWADWAMFSMYHSRSYCDKINDMLGIHQSNPPHAKIVPSMLAPVDKCATALYPHWLYAALCWMSGEWKEYRDRWASDPKGSYPGKPDDNCWQWSGHLLRDWARFLKPQAELGKSFVAFAREREGSIAD